jgi:hypothetical protein
VSGPAAWSTCRRCASCMDASRAAAALARRDDSGPSSAIHGLLPLWRSDCGCLGTSSRPVASIATTERGRPGPETRSERRHTAGTTAVVRAVRSTLVAGPQRPARKPRRRLRAHRQYRGSDRGSGTPRCSTGYRRVRHTILDSHPGHDPASGDPVRGGQTRGRARRPRPTPAARRRGRARGAPSARRRAIEVSTAASENASSGAAYRPPHFCQACVPPHCTAGVHTVEVRAFMLQRALLRLGVGEAGLSSAPASASGATVRAQVRIRM